MQNSIIVVFHKDCKASTDFIVLVSKLEGYVIDYVDIKTDKFEFELEQVKSKYLKIPIFNSILKFE